ncbi:YafY family protein [Nocardioides sp. zg-1228]|uniref:helix-turn-helix transcriptional regulator n=1 Tax=Nocardioides sp. zg-1228 TaxID=2763008 RepID=UPI0016434A75|nr:WYL domain-containing protein [Nocardioides sp. zg-1228]MBC2932049.1 WYL domain-containing protein [Nocardioides sp. zg-1228]QSF57600.1 WYL domain-containing protein [Nocardioides sp. zg-1228]
MSDISPTARALRALDILQARPGTTAADLAARLGVTERAARRYVAILREADIPVESTRGPYGGYTLGRGLRLPPLVFSATEALGLVMAALDSHHAVADSGDPVGAALGKILRVLPTNVARQAVAVRETARAVPERTPVRPDPEVTTELVAAVAAQRQVEVGYRTAAGSERTFVVDPWSVVVRHGRWYLLCHSHHADALRTFRVDRITAVELLDGTFEVPADLDPAAALEANLAKGWEHDTHVVFDAPLDEVRPWIRPTIGELRELPGGRCELLGSTSNPEAYAGEWLAGVPFPFTVAGGAELRAAVAVVAERLGRAVSD